jgi:heme exporter protein B
MLNVLYSVVCRDMTLYCQRRGEWIVPLLFCVMMVTLFPVILRSDAILIAKWGPAVIWLAVVLSLIWSLEAVFRLDYQEGILEQFVMSPFPLPLLIIAKLVAHGIVIGLPLLVLAPLLGFLLQLSSEVLSALVLTLLVGIPSLTLVGALGAALTLGLSQGGVLLAVVVFPWMIPVVLFGIQAVMAVANGGVLGAEILLLLAMMIVLLVTVPTAIATALKISLS